MNECRCPTPPGGRVVCADNQMPMCFVDADGNVHTGCFNRPRTALLAHQVENWILALVTDEPRNPDTTISSLDRIVLRAGFYERPDGTRVTFKIPRNDGGWPDDFGSSGGSPGGGALVEIDGQNRTPEPT